MQPNEIVIQVSGDPRMADRLRGWALTTDIACPACGEGVLLWAENGYVPGYRICSYCGRGWEAMPERDGVHVRIPTVSRDGTDAPEWELPEEWSPEWAENGDGVDKARAHTWRMHGGVGVVHDDGECVSYADPPLRKERSADRPDPEDRSWDQAHEGSDYRND